MRSTAQVMQEPVVSRRVNVLIIESNEIAQIGLRALFHSREWVIRCFGATEAVTSGYIAKRHQPGLILINRRVQDECGLRIARRLRAELPLTKIVILSDHGMLDPRVAMDHGIDETFSLASPASDLLALSRNLLAEEPGTFPRRGEALGSSVLSPREHEVLEKLTQGLSNPEIAGLLHLSKNTVKQHTSALYRKLGVRNRAQAASTARQRGLVA